MKHLVNADHQYDVITLVTKNFSPIFTIDTRNGEFVLGKTNVREHFKDLYARLMDETGEKLGEAPTILGEFGIPFDLNEAGAYTSGDFSDQEKAIDRALNAVESNMLSYTLWNYTSDNSNERGDQWNGEDLSIFSPDQQDDRTDLNSGGRALDAVIRPYPAKTSGIPIHYHFNRKKKELVYVFRNDPKIQAPTELFLPEFHYSDYEVLGSADLEFKWDANHNMLLVFAGKEEREITLVVRGK